MLDNTEDILEKFAKRVIQQSRTRLTKGKMNVNKSLYNSLKYKLDTTPGSFIIHFLMKMLHVILLLDNVIQNVLKIKNLQKKKLPLKVAIQV